MELLGQVSDEQISQAVAVDVGEGGSHVRRCPPHRVQGKTTNCRLLRKSPIASIDEQPIRSSVVRAKNIRPAIAIKIRTDQSKGIAWTSGDTRTNCPVFKMGCCALGCSYILPKSRSRPGETRRRTK